MGRIDTYSTASQTLHVLLDLCDTSCIIPRDHTAPIGLVNRAVTGDTEEFRSPSNNDLRLWGLRPSPPIRRGEPHLGWRVRLGRCLEPRRGR
jgi:hypothetical protein